MSTKTTGVVGRGSGWQIVGIELGSYVFNPNSSQPGMFETFAHLKDIEEKNRGEESRIFLIRGLESHNFALR